jgi:tetratricopeptide (TPR) repeat protein
MGHTLKLPEHLLELGRQYLRQGRDREALDVLGKLIRLGGLPSLVAEEAQVALAEVLLRQGEYAQARRHLHVAIVHRPDSAEYHHLMAVAIDDDEDGDRHRALYYFRKAAELAPDEPAYQCHYGLCLIEMGQPRKGRRLLERAVELDPDEEEWLRHLTEHLMERGEEEEARRLVLFALFRNPDKDAFRQLWQDLRFWSARRRQRETRRPTRLDAADAPSVLPFKPKPSRPDKVVGGPKKVYRLDPASPPSPPHFPRRAKFHGRP